MQKNKIKCFINSFLICTLLFTSFSVPFVISAKPVKQVEQETKENYYNSSYSPISADILLIIEDLETDAVISFNSLERTTEIFVFPVNSVKETTKKFNIRAPQSSCKEFFEIDTKRTVKTDIEGISKIVDFLGGVTTVIPFGISSPANDNLIISLENEPQHIYGECISAFFKSAENLKYEDMLCISQIILNITTAFIDSVSNDVFSKFINVCETNISYADYIDYKDSVIVCTDNTSFSAAKGVWLNNDYILK